MHLDGRDGAGKQSVEHGDRGMRECAGIDDQSCRAGSCLLNPRHQLALVVALAKLYRKSKLGGFTLASCAHVVESLLAIDLRLAGPKQVEIGAVQDVDRFGHGGAWGCVVMRDLAGSRSRSRQMKRAPLSAFPPFGKNDPARSQARWPRHLHSTGGFAALLANLCDVLGQLIVKVVGRPRDRTVADQE